MGDGKDTGQQIGRHSLEWNRPEEAMNRPTGISVDGANCFNLFVNNNNNKKSFVLAPVFVRGRYRIYSCDDDDDT